MFNCFVYWIHLDGQDWCTGYVGVSIDPHRRFKEHKSYTDTILANAIQTYGDKLIYDVIYCGTEDSCYEFEEYLRPTTYIGWNKARGGRFCPHKILQGIKKSVPAWNKGKKIPRTIQENLHRKTKWKEKMESGYIHPNVNNKGKTSTKKGKTYPHLHGKINKATSKEWTIEDTSTGNVFIILSLRNWAKQLSEKTNKKFNTIYSYLLRHQSYDNYKIVNQ